MLYERNAYVVREMRADSNRVAIASTIRRGWPRFGRSRNAKKSPWPTNAVATTAANRPTRHRRPDDDDDDDDATTKMTTFASRTDATARYEYDEYAIPISRASDGRDLWSPGRIETKKVLVDRGGVLTLSHSYSYSPSPRLERLLVRNRSTRNKYFSNFVAFFDHRNGRLFGVESEICNLAAGCRQSTRERGKRASVVAGRRKRGTHFCRVE